jgi:hypothetical protein
MVALRQGHELTLSAAAERRRWDRGDHRGVAWLLRKGCQMRPLHRARLLIFVVSYRPGASKCTAPTYRSVNAHPSAIAYSLLFIPPPLA